MNIIVIEGKISPKVTRARGSINSPAESEAVSKKQIAAHS